MPDPADFDTEYVDRQGALVDDQLSGLLGAAALAALKAWLEAEGLSIVRLNGGTR